MVTVTENVSWFTRIRESIKGVVAGLVFFVVAFPVLFWNEGRAVKTEKSLKEGAGAVVDVPSDRVDSKYEAKLIHVTGKATTDETLTDPDFGVSANAISLRRKVEMYQWKENKKTEERKKLGGGTEKTTTYSYEKVWDSDPISSSSFNESGHDNPQSLPFENRSITAQKVTLGAFELSPSLVGKMSDYETVAADPSVLPPAMQGKVKPADGGFYAGANPSAPQIGDARITFQAVKPAEISVVSQQNGNTFTAYHANAGIDIELLKRGIVTAQAMFESALAENTMMTWILRAVGFIVMFIGLGLVFRPLSVLGDVVPAFGSLLAFGTGLFALVISFALSIGTIAVAWIVYRPVLGILLLSVALASMIALAMRGRKRYDAKKLATATATA